MKLPVPPAQLPFIRISGTWFFRRKIIKHDRLSFLDWIAVFLSLFWLREVFNLTMSVLIGIFNANTDYFGGDEAIISEMLELPAGIIPIILGLCGQLKW